MAGTSCDAKLDFSKISESEILADDVNTDGRAWVKADVEEKIYFVESDSDTDGQNDGLVPAVVIKFNDGCFVSSCPNPSGQNSTGDTAYNPTLLLTAQALNATALVSNGGGGGGDFNGSSTSSIQDTGSVKAKNVCTIDNQAMSSASSSIDAASINDKGNQPAAVIPSAAVIPMKSNVRTYGPFASNNFHTSSGGIGVEVNQDLAPWVFGSTAYMIEAGNAIAQSANIGLLYGETGGVTVPGLPQYGYGQIFGATGPNLTGVTVSFGSNGITTAYDFRTFTPKFGGLTRQYIERFKMIAKYRTEQLRFLRNNQITQGKINRQIKKFNNNSRPRSSEENKPNSSKASLQRILVGGYDSNTNSGERIIVGTSTLAKTAVEMMEQYANKAYMSLDCFFMPISLNGDGGLPSFTNFSKLDLVSSSNHPNPPCSISGQSLYNIDITQTYLNPLTNPFGSGDHHHDGSGDGHALDLVGREGSVPDNGLITNFYSKDDPNRYSDDYRFLGLRGPLVLQSWGYDTNGKPIPNEAENTDRFQNNWLSSPSTWPVGPVDLRFDKNRGVWVSPPPYKLVVAKLDTLLTPFGSASGSIITEHSENTFKYSDDIYDKDGNAVNATDSSSDAKIDIVDKIGGLVPENSLIYAYYDTYTNKYIALNSANSNGAVLKAYYVGSWAKGETKEVTLVKFNTTVDAINYLRDISPDPSSGTESVCYVVNTGENNIYELISAECL